MVILKRLLVEKSYMISFQVYVPSTSKHLKKNPDNLKIDYRDSKIKNSKRLTNE